MRESDSLKPIRQPLPLVPLVIAEAQPGETYEIGIYIVKQGDTLVAICHRMDMTVTDLLKLNPEIKGGLINVGQPIRLYERPKH